MSVTLWGCKKDDPVSAADGSFNVAMTDAPADYEGMDVEILSVDAYLDGQGWVQLSDGPRSVDVLTLTNGKTQQIGRKTNAEHGHYSQLRIIFGDENRLRTYVLLGGVLSLTTYDLAFDGNHEVVLGIDEQVDNRNGAGILVDFDVAASVDENGAGGFTLRPNLSIMHNTTQGAKGEVRGAQNSMVQLANESRTYTTYIDGNGKFLIRGVEEGKYTLTAWAGARTTTSDPVIIENVVVVRGQFRDVGVINF